MTNPSDNTELVQLCGKLRDETISQEEFVRLEALLVSSPQALRFYQRFMNVCSGLEQLAQIETETSTGGLSVADLLEIDGEYNWTDDTTIQLNHAPGNLRQPIQQNIRAGSKLRNGNPSRYYWVACAGVALAAASVIVAIAIVANLPPGGVDDGISAGEETPLVLSASLADTYQAVWSGENVPIDEQTMRGTYSLDSGAVRLRYSNGAELLVQAPSSFSIGQSSRAVLNSGSLTLVVPPSANGFQIETPWGVVVDHGTRIGVRCDTDNGLEAHIFEGRGEVLVANSTSTGVLAAGQAVAVSAKDKNTTSIQLQPAAFLHSFDQLSNLPTVTEDIMLLVTPPQSVRRVRNPLAHLGRSVVFAELSGVSSGDIGRITSTQHGEPDKLESLDQKLNAGGRVDSFLVHFTMPVKQRAKKLKLSALGSLTFSRPVLGICTHEPVRLAKSVGHPATDYQRDMRTGLEDEIDGDSEKGDWISLSEDRRVLHFRLHIRGNKAGKQVDDIDQFRILVESGE